MGPVRATGTTNTNNQPPTSWPALQPRRLHAGGPSRLSSSRHGAVASEAGTEPTRLLQPLAVPAQVLVIRLHLPPPTTGWGWWAVNVLTFGCFSSDANRSPPQHCPAQHVQHACVMRARPHACPNMRRLGCCLTGRGKTCGMHRPRTCQCHRAPWARATAMKTGVNEREHQNAR